MHFVYILYSLKDNRLYKGSTSNIAKRFLDHCNGRVPSTKNRRPLIIIHVELFSSKREALSQERFYKNLQGGILLRQLLIDKNILDDNGKLKAG